MYVSRAERVSRVGESGAGGSAEEPAGWIAGEGDGGGGDGLAQGSPQGDAIAASPRNGKGVDPGLHAAPREVSDVVVMRGSRVVLTRLQFENIHKHFEWNNDPELNRLDSEVPFERETFGVFKARFERMVYRSSPQHLDFEIHLRDGTLIGLAYVMDISPHNRHCTVGVTIGDRSHWGVGFGRESLELLLDYCFNALGMHRVSTAAFEYNEPWRRLIRDAGFRRDGIERDYLYRDGAFWDKEVYSLLAEEYQARPALRRSSAA